MSSLNISGSAQPNTQQPPTAEPERPGPRLGQYRKLLHRFYEPLFLLHTLGQTRGDHTSHPEDVNDEELHRRRFLRNLAYICDFGKGGVSCTALGLEDAEDRYKIWVAVNREDNRVPTFLRAALLSLSRLINIPEERRELYEREFLNDCVGFAARRCKDQVACLRRAIRESQEILERQGENEDEQFATWLDSLTHHDDHVTLCQAAYEASRSNYMERLSVQADAELRRQGPQGRRSSFAGVRHYVGRLAYRIRAHRQLIKDAHDMHHILDCEVHPIDKVLSVPQPVPDNRTTMKGVINRMLKKDNPERVEIERVLLNMDHRDDWFAAFLNEYPRCQPQVHAEIQALEHFYKNRLRFVDDDRYIACSKPACLCCKLYFQYHPARMVIPESHQKVWISWGPPLVVEFKAGDVESNRQRDLMIRITDSIREDAIAQILRSSRPPPWHPDSQTGLTESVPLQHANPFSPNEGLISSSSDFIQPEAEILGNGHATPDDAAGESDSDSGGVSLYL
ncbi:hypothetical protein PT974_04936 [Cladobotryum mycophilum]|uniref:Uncharacterized protein n=1 Tax=Cladobotryum mycophilum TaxID=491253 RepID=A0ABR0SRW3_9HYPO